MRELDLFTDFSKKAGVEIDPMDIKIDWLKYFERSDLFASINRKITMKRHEHLQDEVSGNGLSLFRIGSPTTKNLITGFY